MLCCALDLNGFRYKDKTYVYLDNKWRLSRSEVALPGIMTRDMAEDILVKLSEYFPNEA